MKKGAKPLKYKYQKYKYQKYRYEEEFDDDDEYADEYDDYDG